MIATEMQQRINDIISTGYKCGLTPFFCMKLEKGVVKREIKVDDSLYALLYGLLFESIKKVILAEDVELDSSENIVDNRNVLYEIIQNDEYKPFAFLDECETDPDEKIDQDSIMGFAFRINCNSKYFWVYQHVYPAAMIKRSKSLYAIMGGNNTYIPLKKDVIKIGNKIDAIIIDKSIITSNIKLMQSSFGFEMFIRKEAQKTIELIDTQGIVSDISKFFAFEDKQRTTNAKKLMKAKSSPVLKMKKSELMDGIAKHSRYKTIIKIENGQIIINSQKDVNEFIKMLNDDIVRSDLTNVEYDSSSKHELPPV